MRAAVYTPLCGCGVAAPCRYAYMSPSQYKRWFDNRGRATALPGQQRTRENLLSWMVAEDDHVRAELRCTARQLGIDLHGPAFRVSTDDTGHGSAAASPAWMAATQENVSGGGMCPMFPHRTPHARACPRSGTWATLWQASWR